MTRIVWDQVGERVYETGVDHGVLYIPNAQGVYATGTAWNGLTAVTESPSGAEASPQYADNIKYLNLVSAEEFGATIEAFTYPDEFMQCDGTATPVAGVAIGQQGRSLFGLSYRTKIGNDLTGSDAGFKLHYATVNDSPEAITFSWEISTTAVEVPNMKPAAQITIDSTKVSADGLAALEAIIYGTAGVDARLPLPEEVLALFSGSVVQVVPEAPTYVPATKIITIPAVTGVVYKIDGVTKPAGPTAPITRDTVVTAHPAIGYKFPAVTDDDWFFAFA